MLTAAQSMETADPHDADAVADIDNMFAGLGNGIAGVPGEEYLICTCSWKPEPTPDDLHAHFLLILCLRL